jgi:hypothetical protein
MPDSKFQFDSVRAVIRLRVRSVLRQTPKIVLQNALATRTVPGPHTLIGTSTPLPPLSSHFIARLNRGSRLSRAKAIYYPFS